MEAIAEEYLLPVKVTVGEYIGQRLRQLGVTHLFTVPGDFSLNLLDELNKDPSLTMVGCCNEMVAGYAADGYCRASCGLGVVCVTYMVGGLSVLNAVAGAYSEDLPLLVISGGPNTNDQKEGHRIHHTIGEADLYQCSRCFEPVTGKTFVIRRLHEAAGLIDHAFSECLSLQKPVYLEIPCNLSNALLPQPCPMEHMDPNAKRASDNHSMGACLDHVLHLIAQATRPVVVAGSKLRLKHVLDEFMHFANALGCGIAMLANAKGLMNEEHPNFIGTYWSDASSNKNVVKVVESADLIIYVGCLFSDYSVLDWQYRSQIDGGPKTVRIQNNHTWADMSRYHSVVIANLLSALAVRVPLKEGSLKEFQRLMEAEEGFHELGSQHSKESEEVMIAPTSSLIDEGHGEGIAFTYSDSASDTDGADAADAADSVDQNPRGGGGGKHSGDAVFADDGKGGDANSGSSNSADTNAPLGSDLVSFTIALTVQGIVDALQTDLTRNPSTALLVDVGDAWFIGHKVKLAAQSTFYMQLHYASLGWAMGAAIGIKAVRHGQKRLMAIVGDGAMQVTVEALSTLIREHAVMTVVVVNNSGYGIERAIHDGPYNDVQNWNYAALPEVFKNHDVQDPTGTAPPQESAGQRSDEEATDATTATDTIGATPMATVTTTSDKTTAGSAAAAMPDNPPTTVPYGRAWGVKVRTCSELADALRNSETFDGVALIECIIPRDNCTEEMIRFGSAIAKANMRM